MIPRYTTSQMAKIWSDEARFADWLAIEFAALDVFEAQGLAPKGLGKELRAQAKGIDWPKFAARALEIEQTTRHDVIAFLTALEEVLGPGSRFLHLGMTSSDVVDTAFALALKKSGEQLLERMSELKAALREQAERHRHLVCLGRTHGQAAEPTTFGLKLLSYYAEMERGHRRLLLAIEEISHAKLSGAVGNYGNIAPDVEAKVMKALGLVPEAVSTQVVPRDRHAVFFGTLAVIAGGVERLAVEIRHLMRTEVAEAFEPFGAGQKGSSAMPHKKNPILTENVTGLARLVRNYAGAAYENQALWHERDISHSSVERVIAPDATTVLDFALTRMTQVVRGLEVDAEKMRSHIDATQGMLFSEGVLLALVKKGVLRQKAYEWVQRAALSARQGVGTFAANLKADADVAKHLSAEGVDEIFDEQHHLRHVDVIFARIFPSS